MDGREGTVRDFAARCSGIIMEAIKWAPETTRSLLQVCMVEYFWFMQGVYSPFAGTLFPTSRCVFSFAFSGLTGRVLEKRPLPWVETHCVEHARQLLSDRTLA